MKGNTWFKRVVNENEERVDTELPASIASTSITFQSRTFYLIGLFIIIITLIAYSPLPWNKFVIYDDPEYVTENLTVLGGLTVSGLTWALRSTYQMNWHPLTWLSHMLDAQLYGLNPIGHHITSLLIHIANSLLVLTVLRKMTGALWRSALVAILFAIHPLHVESVAWVAERKDVLCALFWLLTMWAYLVYSEKPGWINYLLVLLSFALGIMSKPMMVTLPVILFLLDYWPLRRKASLLVLISEKIPLFMMSAGSSIVTYRSQMGCGRTVIHDLHAQMNAIQVYVVYMVKTVWPTRLAVLYPFDDSVLTPLRTGVAALILLAITIAVTAQIKKRPYLFVGWCWYVVALVPVVGIFRIGYHAMADRYTYLPHIGLFVIVSWGLAEFRPATVPLRRAAGAALILVVGLFSMLTYKQVKLWGDTISLMKHTVSVTDNNWLAHNNLACAYYLIGTNHRVPNISASLPLDPARADRRLYYLKLSVDEYSAALKIKPDYLDAANNLKLTIPLMNRLELEQRNAGGFKRE
jgi:hypothetical protein